jgi:hypothetical protein
MDQLAPTNSMVKVLLVQIEQIEIGAGQFPQGPPQQKT